MQPHMGCCHLPGLCHSVSFRFTCVHTLCMCVCWQDDLEMVSRSIELDTESLSLSLSLRFNGHFPRGPGLVDTTMSPFWILLELRAKDDGGGGDNWRRAKLQSNCHHQQTSIRLFTGRISFLSPNQQCRSTEGKNVACKNPV